MPLTDRQIKNAKPADKAYKLADGGGLYLQVTPAGGKLWRLKYRVGGKEKLLSIGKYPLISLLEAREAAESARRLLAAGQDPGDPLNHTFALSDRAGLLVVIDWHISYSYPNPPTLFALVQLDLKVKN